MADNTTLSVGSGGDVLRDKDRSGVKTPICALDLNPAGIETLMAGAMPVTGTFFQATQPISIAAPVAVTGTFWQATQPVSGTVAATQSGVWAIGIVSTVGAVTSITNALPAGTNLLGITSSPAETSTIYNGTTPLTPLFAAISASSSGANTIVTATGGKRIRVLRYALSSNGAVNAKFQTSTGPTDLTGLEYLTQFARGGGAYCPLGLFQTGIGDSLILNLSGAVAVGGCLTYVLV